MLRVLIIRLSSLGDIVQTFPTLYDIKANLPEVNVDWIVDESFAELLQLNSLVDNILIIPLRHWKKDKKNLVSNFIKWKNHLSYVHYDYIIDLHGLIKSSLVGKAFQGVKCGYDFQSANEKLASFFYDKKFKVARKLLVHQRSRLLTKQVFNYEIDLNTINFGLNTPHITIADNIIIFTGTSKKKKKWDHWLDLIKFLLKQTEDNIILPYGTKEELEEVRKLAINDRVIIPKKMNYQELSLLIQQAKFIFGVDTGLVHLSNAYNKPLIAIYTSTNPKISGIIETEKAKNIGAINKSPKLDEVIDLYWQIKHACNL